MSLPVPGPASRFLLTVSATLISFVVYAQTQPAAVQGSVRAGTGPALEYVTITLHRATDSVAVKTEFSDASGAYQIMAAPGRYLLSGAQLGYGRAWSGPFDLSAAGLVLPVLQLMPSAATALGGVTVTGTKAQFERLADRTVVNVEDTPLSAGNTTLDVLNRAPGLTIDANDNLSLRGKSGLLVLIDGKRQPMTGTELVNYLRSLPAEQVHNIELITNPPAKYDAQGGAGIIAINLKKDQRQGTNGTVNASYGRGRYGKFTSGLSLNHRHKGLNVFGTYAYADRQGFQELDFYRTFYQDNAVARTSIQNNDSRTHLQSHTWRAGLDYNVSARTQVGLVVSGLDSRYPFNGPSTTQVFDAQGILSTRFASQNYRVLRTPNQTASISVRHSLPADSSGTPELSADVDYARYPTTRTLQLLSIFELPARTPILLTGDQEGRLTIGSARADFVRPLPHSLRLDAGLKASQVTSDNDVLFENTVDGETTIDVNKTNQFHYKETIAAGYFSLTRTRPNLTITAGLRGENTTTTGQQQVGNQRFKRQYFQLFPNISLTRTLSEQQALAFSFSRRLDRPTYNQLNPFRSYIDATSYRTGNPTLYPQTSYVAELTHTLKQKFVTGVSYTRTNRPILNVSLLDMEGIVAATDVNLRTQHYYAATLTAPFELAKWCKLYTNAEVFYIYFEGTLADGSTPPQGRPGAIFTSNASFTLGKGWSADLNGNYHTPEWYAFQRVRSFGQASAGVQKAVGSHATLRLNVADIFYTTPLRATSTYASLRETFRTAQDSRFATVAYTYRFGNEKVAAARKRSGAAEDEKRRASSVQ
ncbi:outer membrane beta-barrel protein [Hymenobacter mucosus]|uniref:Outer membrane receptor proteins, mostly Fe transport n=1 Tax=Hymenobacter mucosus TaxID=1411120 RepID=A0A238VDL3_9BACT|nr:outer membrane beta-barrel protein [Hymenobacter mucosus]SNR31619.1 Outer membrane receptor proteins, mostly Fe transport [Hymenobacter mucosus]